MTDTYLRQFINSTWVLIAFFEKEYRVTIKQFRTIVVGIVFSKIIYFQFNCIDTRVQCDHVKDVIIKKVKFNVITKLPHLLKLLLVHRMSNQNLISTQNLKDSIFKRAKNSRT